MVTSNPPTLTLLPESGWTHLFSAERTDKMISNSVVETSSWEQPQQTMVESHCSEPSGCMKRHGVCGDGTKVGTAVSASDWMQKGRNTRSADCKCPTHREAQCSSDKYRSNASVRKRQKVRVAPSSTLGRTRASKYTFTCKVCSKLFTNKTNLVVHSITHIGEHPVSCKMCGKLFTIASDLVVHNRTHIVECPFKCELCSEFSTNSADPVIHSIIRVGKCPFPCKLCSELFTNKSNPAYMGEPSFTCDVCSKTFTNKTNLVVHSITHTVHPFRCKLCCKSFTNKSKLIVHSRIHTVDGSFTCSICGTLFKGERSLLMHNRTHSKDLAKDFKKSSSQQHPFSCTAFINVK